MLTREFLEGRRARYLWASIVGTIAKAIGIGAIRLAASFVAFVLTAYWVSLYA